MAVDIEILKQLYESGYTLKQCCNYAGLKSSGSLLKRFRNHQVSVRTVEQSKEKYKLKLPIKQIIAMYEAGLSCLDIAEYFNCSRSSIDKYLRINGKQLRSVPDAVSLAMGSMLNPPTRELILSLRFEKKMTYSAIARRTGISKYVISRWCRINSHLHRYLSSS
jgi:DNA invertase Pin-like site-specific DNA recombinase